MSGSGTFTSLFRPVLRAPLAAAVTSVYYAARGFLPWARDNVCCTPGDASVDAFSDEQSALLTCKGRPRYETASTCQPPCVLPGVWVLSAYLKLPKQVI